MAIENEVDSTIRQNPWAIYHHPAQNVGNRRTKRGPSINTAAIDISVEAQIRGLRIPGAALAIIEDDRVTHRRGYGRSHPGGEAPTSQTPFSLGSTTRSFTALAVMQLVETGKIDPDTPVRRYLRWFRVAGSQASARMTVHHLLTQTRGMSMVAGTACLAALDDNPETRKREARNLATFELSRPVGESFQYWNLNNRVLGLVIEAVSGQPYVGYVHEPICVPLDMGHTHASANAVESNGLATGHRYWFGVRIPARDLPFPRGPLSAGGLASTSEALAHYVIARSQTRLAMKAGAERCRSSRASAWRRCTGELRSSACEECRLSYT